MTEPGSTSTTQAAPQTTVHVHRINGNVSAAALQKALGQAGENDRGSGPRSTPTVDGARLVLAGDSYGGPRMEGATLSGLGKSARWIRPPRIVASSSSATACP